MPVVKHRLNVKPLNNSNNMSLELVKSYLMVYMDNGMTVDEAAKLCGVSDYHLGIIRSDPEFEEFVQTCSLRCENDHLRNISDAGRGGQWQASAWFLERKFPDKYGKKDTIKHEYELKLVSYQKIMMNIINELEPAVRHMIIQKLRNVDLDEQIHLLQESNSIDNTVIDVN